MNLKLPPLRWGHAPMAAQVIALLVLAVFTAQAMALVVIFALPPPREPLYRLNEIAAALDGGSTQTQFGARLVRTTTKTPPELSGGEPEWSARNRRALAALLHTPEARVRFVDYGPAFSYGLGPGPRRWLGRRDRRGPEFREPPADSAERGLPPHRHERPILGGFVAAVQTPEGAWIQVQPTPGSFPTAWQKRVLLWILGSFLIVAPVGWLFARRITAPVRAFAQAAEQLGRDPRAAAGMAVKGSAEIAVAGQAFNDMQVRIKRYVEDRTAMVSAISHDLRTPLARIRFKIERAEPDVRQSVAADVEQMERMIDAVLDFTQGASESRPGERVDLLSLLECAVDDAALMGAEVTLEDNARDGALVVEADALGLQRLFANLVDNAVKYGGGARLSLRREVGEAVVDVTDRGPGIAEADLERVFQPFFRADPARNMDNGEVGLGLSVARSIARAHGGDVSLISGEAGLTARVRLPLPA